MAVQKPLVKAAGGGLQELPSGDSISIPLSWISTSGASTGYVIKYTGGVVAWAPDNDSGGGGGGDYTLPAATVSTLGGVKVGAGLSVSPDGTLSVSAGGGAGAYRWYRLYILSNNGNSYTAFAEIELRGVTGGPPLTSPSSPAFASSSYFLTPPNLAIDGDYTDDTKCWIDNAQGFPCWWAVDLSSAQTVIEFSLRCQLSEPNRGPRKFALQGGNSPVSDPAFVTDWKTLATYMDVTGWVAGTPKVFSVGS